MGILTLILILREKEFNVNGYNKLLFALIFVSQFVMYNLFIIFWILYYTNQTVDFINGCLAVWSQLASYADAQSK